MTTEAIFRYNQDEFYDQYTIGKVLQQTTSDIVLFHTAYGKGIMISFHKNTDPIVKLFLEECEHNLRPISLKDMHFDDEKFMIKTTVFFHAYFYYFYDKLAYQNVRNEICKIVS